MKNKPIVRFLEKIIVILTILALIYCAGASFLVDSTMEYDFHEMTVYHSDSILQNIVGILLFAGVFYLLIRITKRLRYRVLFVILMAVVIGISFYLIDQINLLPTYDAKYVWQSGELLFSRDYSPFTGGYISRFPYQIFLMFYDMLEMLVFGDNYIAPQLLNVILLIGSCYFLCQITWIVSHHSSKAVKVFIFNVVLFFPLVLYTMYVYSNVPFLFFNAAGLFFAVKWMDTEKQSFLAISYGLLIIASFLKGTGYISIIALTMLVAARILRSKQYNSLLISLISIFLIVAIPKSIYSVFEKADPSIVFGNAFSTEGHLIMGVTRSSRGAGWYGDTFSVINALEVPEEEKPKVVRSMVLEAYRSLLDDPILTLAFFKDKFNSMWANPDFQSFWLIETNRINESSITDDPEIEKRSFLFVKYRESRELPEVVHSLMNGEINKTIISILNIQQILIYSFAAYYMIARLKKHKLYEIELLLPLTFLGGFMFLAIWEAKAQYAMLFYVLLLPIAAISCAEVSDKKTEFSLQKYLSHNEVQEQ